MNFLSIPAALLLFAGFSTALQTTTQNCPLLGAVFPFPSKLSESTLIKDAGQQFSDGIVQYAKSGNDTIGTTIDLNSVTFSVNVFSATENSSLFEYHNTAPSVANSTSGVHKVDSDSIYRVGSISKLFTVMSFLVAADDTYFSQPVTKYVPELAADSKNLSSTDYIDGIHWDEVTLGELASHLGGVGRYVYIGDLSSTLPDPEAFGLPPLDPAEIPSCNVQSESGFVPCTRKQFFDGLIPQHPTFPTSVSPTYSNSAFQILAYALETITGKPFATSLYDGILKPLGMTKTSLESIGTECGVIPYNETFSSWNISIGDGDPFGSVYSSSNDLAKLGRGILNSELMPAAQTRRWMRPRTGTASLTQLVGAPWEIQRVTLNNRLFDVYTKGGDIGAYSGILALSIDHQVGFSVLTATSKPNGDEPTKVAISELLVQAFFPAIEAAAKEEAKEKYTGVYEATTPEGLNSSITVVTDDRNALSITRWISNGTDFFTTLVGNGNASVRLYPTGLTDSSRYAFRAVYETFPTLVDTGLLGLGNCINWFSVDSPSYGNVPMDEFIFHFGPGGGVTGLEIRVLRLILTKKTS